MKFCPDCSQVLIIRTDSDHVIFYCLRCNKEFDGDPEDSLIQTGSTSSYIGLNTSTILKYAPYDRTVERHKKSCPTPGCGRKYMSIVIIDDEIFYTCDNCNIQPLTNKV